MRWASLSVASRVLALTVLATASGLAVTALPSVLGPRSPARAAAPARAAGAPASVRTAPAQALSTRPAPVVRPQAQMAASIGTRAVAFGRPEENGPNAKAYEHVGRSVTRARVYAPVARSVLPVAP